ncbi:MAG: hypothetical protein FVQ84_08865 [Planctomycetes bacterium]|nr:hypothetical protein [Planctomycetota bacterium]
MRNTASRILKESDVKLDGQFTLDIVQTETGSSKEVVAALVEPQVRIVESQSEFSVIEITCSCGTSMYLRCEYAGVKAAEISEQNAEPEMSTV